MPGNYFRKINAAIPVLYGVFYMNCKLVSMFGKQVALKIKQVNKIC